MMDQYGDLRNFASMIITSKRRSTFYESSTKNTIEIEELLNLNQLKELRKLFTHGSSSMISDRHHQNIADFFERKFSKPDSLNKDELTHAFSSFFTYFADSELEKFFNKLDSEDTGRVTWSEFCNHLLVYYREKDYTQSLRYLPFTSAPKLTHSTHNQLAITVKILTLVNPLKFINVTRRGVIGIWNRNLVFEKKFKIDQEQEDEAMCVSKSLKPRTFTWINDAALIKNLHKLVVISSARELRIFSLSSEYCFEDYCITGLPSAPICLESYFKDNKGLLLIGFEDGTIGCLRFINIRKNLFDTTHKPLKGVHKFYWKNLFSHESYVQHSIIHTSHTESIRKLKFIHENNTIISASGDSKSSILVTDLDKSIELYAFKLNKGCLCFDYEKEINVLVTGSTDALVRVWNPYMVNKPIAELNGHKTVIIDVKIHKRLSYVYSLSLDGNLKVWDLTDHTYLQQIMLNFPTLQNGKIPDYGSNPIHLHIDSKKDDSNQGQVLVACDDYIASIRLGEKEIKSRSSHDASILCMIYSHVLSYVATGDIMSTLIIWNIENGNQIAKVKRAHKTQEITAMCLDRAERRVFTGARDGSIRLWSMVNGQFLQKFLSFDSNEITGLVCLSDRKLLLSVGWSKRIISYPVKIDDTILPVRPDFFGNNSYSHKDDILCADLCSNMLVTGSYDGEINVWNTGNEKLILTLRKGRNVSLNDQLNDVHNVNRSKRRKINRQSMPIDNVLFLKHRVTTHGLSSGFIISSENGTLNFWSLYADRSCLGGFYAPKNEKLNIFALASDSQNNVLIAGDSHGYVYVYEIKDYLIKFSTQTKQAECLFSWKSHDLSIVSCQIIDSTIDEIFLITSSLDKLCKLWTLSGCLVGVFGQRNAWSIDNSKTFASNAQLSINDELKQRLRQFFTSSLDGLKAKQKTKVKQVDILPELVLNSQQTINVNVKKDSHDQFGFELIPLKATKQEKHVNKAIVTVYRSNFDYLDSLKFLKQKETKHQFNEWSDTKKFKINNYDIHDERYVRLTKQERRNIYGDIDHKFLTSNPNKCAVSPYSTLIVPKVHSSTDFAKDFNMRPKFENFINDS